MARAAASRSNRSKRSTAGPRRSGRRRSGRAGAGRWLLLPLGLAIAVAAIYLLATLGPDEGAPGAGAPLDDIDRASREKLEQLLIEAEREQ